MGSSNGLEVSEYGRLSCEKMRKIRKMIAEINDIEYEGVICDSTGPCVGTCPACDADIAYLNKELRKKRKNGEEIYIVKIPSMWTAEYIDNKRSSYCQDWTETGFQPETGRLFWDPLNSYGDDGDQISDWE